MCNADVFSAKYRSKFTTLLHTSLKSTNLPAYTVAAFIKRLANLAIKIPGPSASYCLAQGVTLLRNHPQCLKLIHNTDNAVSEGVCKLCFVYFLPHSKSANLYK
jgi:U3 small nucleolar RNA-associated protein 19